MVVNLDRFPPRFLLGAGTSPSAKAQPVGSTCSIASHAEWQPTANALGGARGYNPIRLWLVQTDVSDGLFSSVYGADCGHPSWAMQGCASSTAVAFAVDYSRAGSEASDLCNGGVGPVAEMNDMSGKGVETGNGMNISRVPKLCPRYAFWTLLAYVATRKISNLRYLNRAKKTDPPSRHHDKIARRLVVPATISTCALTPPILERACRWQRRFTSG